MTLLEEFSKGLEGKDIDQLIHEAKAESENRRAAPSRSVTGHPTACERHSLAGRGPASSKRESK